MTEKKRFEDFLSEAKLIKDTKGAKYSISDEIENCIILEGEIIGKDTHEKIVNLGRKHGLLVLARELSVMYRETEIEKVNARKKTIH